MNTIGESLMDGEKGQLLWSKPGAPTTLTRFLSGHTRSLTFSDSSKCFEICPKCTAEQATPDHILACLGLSKQDLVSNPLLALDFFRVHRLMDLI
ncbi:hypothetical protein AVEN_155354-1 [Araneus ventricosus]|uniref:Uncharacterized protein n=1 Tax=Araneus ventricosus TaxID=182803 RepID=A0A4Y2LW26_ARAVE|nr:hypothetical protein AVEN_155354-1 [Araneus ventricosus]